MTIGATTTMPSMSSGMDLRLQMRSNPQLCFTSPPGEYTAVVRGTNGATGNALVEVYDLD